MPSSNPQPDRTLVKALARVHPWQRMIAEVPIPSLARSGTPRAFSESYVSRILRLALLAADIVEMVLGGRPGQALMLKRLERPVPASWDEQREQLRSSSGA